MKVGDRVINTNTGETGYVSRIEPSVVHERYNSIVIKTDSHEVHCTESGFKHQTGWKTAE